VAREAGVAVGTVSRFLNGYRLRSENNARVVEAIDRLGYKENFIAKGMKTRKTHTIGIALTANDEFQIEIIRALESRLYSNGYTLLICDYEDDLRVLDSKLAFFLDRYVDGLVANPLPRSRQYFEPYRERNIPVVFYDYVLPGFSTDAVSSDHQSGARTATEYLISMGHRRIGFLGGPGNHHYTASERKKGFAHAFQHAGIQVEPGLIMDGTWYKDSGYINAMKLLKTPNPPTALFSANYMIGVGALRAIKELGMKIPQDISIVSFDDVDIFEIYQPGITAVRQPAAQIATLAADLLLERLRGNGDARYRHITLSTELIIRESVKKL
jgi:LacI family transcriptional regulator